MFIRFVINTIINIYIDRAVGGGAKRVCCDTHNANSDVCECVYTYRGGRVVFTAGSFIDRVAAAVQPRQQKEQQQHLLMYTQQQHYLMETIDLIQHQIRASARSQRTQQHKRRLRCI